MILATHGIIGSSIVQFAFDADYQAVLDYATTQGYTLPSAGQQTLQNQLVVDLKAGGIWNKLDTFAVFATDGSSDFALIDWIRLSDYTAVNSPTFTTDEGFQGNGTSSYIDSNFSPSNSVNANINSISFGYFCNQIDTAPSSGEGLWATSNSNAPIHWIRYTTKRIYVNSGSVSYVNFNATSNQFVATNRINSLNLNLYSNGIFQDSVSALTSLTLDTTKMFALKWTSNFSDAKISMTYYGSNLTNEMSDFYNAWNTYITSL
jgi:hypothetical protein